MFPICSSKSTAKNADTSRRRDRTFQSKQIKANQKKRRKKCVRNHILSNHLMLYNTLPLPILCCHAEVLLTLQQPPPFLAVSWHNHGTSCLAQSLRIRHYYIEKLALVPKASAGTKPQLLERFFVLVAPSLIRNTS